MAGYYIYRKIIITDLGRTLLDEEDVSVEEFTRAYSDLISAGFKQSGHEWGEISVGDVDLFLEDDETGDLLLISYEYCGGKRDD